MIMYNVYLTDQGRYAVNDENNRMCVFMFGFRRIIEGSESIHSIHTNANDALDTAIELNRKESEYFNTHIDHNLERIDHDIEITEKDIKHYEKKLEVLKLTKHLKLRKINM